jgi:uncharacterized protein YdiU (UPF0061 family)
LPTRFYSRVEPTHVAAPRLIKFNSGLAEQLSIRFDPQNTDDMAQVFSGNRLLLGSEPLAMAYAGHQFGNFVPQLGDGRAILIGEVRDQRGMLRDIHLKGAGRTAYSRGGDGRAALGPVLREYIVSEAMTALGIPSTRSLAAVLTGESVYREGPLPGAILTRVAASHVRVGTFQYFAARGDLDGVRILADYVIQRHYPEIGPSEARFLELLQTVVRRQAQLVARWLQVGFIHGVMNTDNTSVSGESIDFGPCAFMDVYDPNTVFSSIDRQGRYSYGNQSSIAQWNLARFAETLLPLIDSDNERAVKMATEVIIGFTAEFEQRWLEGMRAKIGLSTARPGDAELIQSLLSVMQQSAADFTLTFRALCSAAEHGVAALSSTLGPATREFEQWLEHWKSRCSVESLSPQARAAAMRAVNPKYIPRNHRIEQLIAAAVDGDFSLFETLHEILARPFDVQPAAEKYAAGPLPEERVLETFCGT